MHFVQALVLSSAVGPRTTLPQSCQRVRAAHALPTLHHMVTALTGLRQAKNCRGRGKIPSEHHRSMAEVIKLATEWKKGAISSCMSLKGG